MGNLLYIEYVPTAQQAAFTAKVNEIALYLQINPNWLMQVMKSESGVKPTAQNHQSGHLVAAGLIQWTAASGVPGAPQSILTKDIFQQLDLVKAYFAPYRGKMKSYFDVYLITFFPAAVGKGDDFVFETTRYSAGLIAAQNPALNINKDNKITMAEFKQYLLKTVPEKLRAFVFSADVLKATAITAGSILTFFLPYL